MNIFNKVLVSDLAITAFFCQQIPGQWGGASVRFVLMLCEIARVLRGMAWPRRGSKRTYSSLSPHWNISPEICADITSILLLHTHTDTHTHPCSSVGLSMLMLMLMMMSLIHVQIAKIRDKKPHVWKSSHFWHGNGNDSRQRLLRKSRDESFTTIW